VKKILTSYEVILGVTGGIAAYKSAHLCSRLVQYGAGVSVVMTTHAEQFVGRVTFSTLSGREVYHDLFNSEQVYSTEHISLTDRADLIVVAPATANIIAKTAQGICDDLLSTLLCSADSDVLMAPAMNHRMWNNPATQQNIETLCQRGCRIIGPVSGHLACGQEGIGRMCEPEEILQKIIDLLTSKRSKNDPPNPAGPGTK